MFPYLRRARNEEKRKESERHVLMLEFVRQSHLFQIISRILQDIRIIMRRSNRNFNIPPPRANPGHLTIFCARGVGNLTGKAFPGVGNLTFAGENWTGSVRFQMALFFGRRILAKSLTAINTCLGEMEEFKGRDSICERLAYKKRSSKVV